MVPAPRRAASRHRTRGGAASPARAQSARTLPGRAFSARTLRGMVAFAAVGLVSAGCASMPTTPVDGDGIPRSTTRIVGAPVLGVEREPGQACGPEAPLDPGASPALDARRIVAVGYSALDTLCALGLQERVVAVAAPADVAPLRYLGGWASHAQAAGSAENPDGSAIQAAGADLILIDQQDAADAALGSARTVVVPTDGPWTRTVEAVAESVGRGAAARAMIGGFTDSAATTGHDIAAAQAQASIARFTADSLEILGPASFAGQVLQQIGVHRPPSQRFGSPAVRTLDPGDVAALEGDVLFLSFAGKDSGEDDAGGDTAALRHGEEVMDSDAWASIAVTENRTFTVDDGVWSRGRGLVAAREILDDVRGSLNAYG
ncbi:ABC transporter substrate-binding protein [Tomitella fengzijianii]|uniref:ABC transporter substrate-binding protein n=1 Tax=Tomitella fengzijianii TaxID=2597660 RepID=A0A516X4Y3_9ACTN|nr:ABC transporter substrate-binding protein [Tomitella fengzijianii]QDQ98126.1 ABC transporter substrate-binding protein [Tomitella fengzijianii]